MVLRSPYVVLFLEREIFDFHVDLAFQLSATPLVENIQIRILTFEFRIPTFKLEIVTFFIYIYPTYDYIVTTFSVLLSAKAQKR